MTLGDASVDFSAFLGQFAGRYPDYFKNGLYVAGESFAGRYVPRFVADMAQKQLANASDALNVSIRGIILVDALIDAAYPYLGHYDLFCSDHSKILRYNDSACAQIAASTPELLRLQRVCQDTNSPDDCGAAEDYGASHIYSFFQEQVSARNHTPYDCERVITCFSLDRPC